jgi:hypothetical protein
MNEPFIQDWRELYSAAVDLENLKPWKWMSEDDIFAIQNSVND